MPRMAKPSLDHDNPLYKAEVHKRPFSTFTHDGKEWLVPEKEDGIIAELDKLEVDTKAVLYARSPLSVSKEIGGDLFEVPEYERYRRLFNHFAPQLWKLTVLSALLSKRPLPGTTVEMSPHLCLLTKAFFELAASDYNADPMDYKVAIERGIFSYMKYLPTDEFQTHRKRIAQHIYRQKTHAKKALSRASFASPFIKGANEENDHYLTLAFGYLTEHRDIREVLLDKDKIIARAKMAYKYALRSYTQRKNLHLQYVMRLCYSPLYGHYWILVMPAVNAEIAQTVKHILAMRWVLSQSRDGFCATPNIEGTDLESIREYVLLQVAKEGLIHTSFEHMINCIYHNH